MGRRVQLDAPGTVTVAPYDDAAPGAGQVRIQTLYSGISAGTELTQYRGSNPHLLRRWDREHRLFADGPAPAAYPLDTWGYEEVGRVAAVGAAATHVSPGQLVWGDWGHRSSTVVDGRWAAERLLPPGMPPLHGIFARIGAVALNAVLDADIHVGEDVAVFGLGVPGLLAVQLARLNGGRAIAVDRVGPRLRLAEQLGAAAVVDASERPAAEEIRRHTAGRGADVSIELTGAYAALHDAVRATASNSRVVCAGFLQGEGVGLSLGEEFHHNRITLLSSQISAVRPDLSHRWSRHRLERTVIGLIADGRLDVAPLITHVLPVERAAEAFELLDRGAPDVLQVVLSFSDDGQPP